MMRSSPPQNPSPANRDAVIDFAFKVLIPAVPVVGISLAVIYMVNADFTGEYKGSSPETGAAALILNERNGRLTGELVLKDRIHLPVSEGHMIDDKKFELVFRPLQSQLRSKKRAELNAPTFVGTHDQNTIEGLFNNGSLEIPLKLRRGATSAFFSRRWFDRFVSYFGGATK